MQGIIQWVFVTADMEAKTLIYVNDGSILKQNKAVREMKPARTIRGAWNLSCEMECSHH